MKSVHLPYYSSHSSSVFTREIWKNMSIHRLARQFFCRFIYYFCKNIYFIIIFLLIYFYFWLCAGSLVVATLRCSAWASHCSGFSCCGAQALSAQASVVVACGLSSCGARASLLRSTWDLPGPGLEPVSPALAGGFLTTVPPGKPCRFIFHSPKLETIQVPINRWMDMQITVSS